MSIAKAKSVSHTKQCLAYVINKQGAEELCRENLSGETPAELYDEFRVIQSLNDRCQNNTIRIEISPAIADGERLSRDEWRDIITEFMQRMELSANRQFIAILHTDRPHKHAHILANRIDFNGVAYNDSNISRRAGAIMEQIAIERGMTTAMSVHLERLRVLQPLKDEILQAHRTIARRGLSPSQYQSLMAQQGVEVVFNQSKTTGRITGMSYIVGGTKLKASSVSRNLSFNQLFGALKELPPRKLSPRQRLMRQSPVRVGSIKHDLDRLLGYGVQAHTKPEQTDEEYEKEYVNKLDFEL